MSRNRWLTPRISTPSLPPPSGASPTPKPVMLRIGSVKATTNRSPVPGLSCASKTFATLYLIQHTRVFGLPLAAAVAHVPKLCADLSIEQRVDGHVLLEDGSHLAPKFDVFDIDLVDAARVHEHRHHLIQKVVERLVAHLDALLLGDQLPHPRVVALRLSRALEHVFGAIADFPLVAQILGENGRNVGLDVLRILGLDVFRREQTAHELSRDRGDLSALEAHGREPS